MPRATMLSWHLEWQSEKNIGLMKPWTCTALTWECSHGGMVSWAMSYSNNVQVGHHGHNSSTSVYFKPAEIHSEFECKATILWGEMLTSKPCCNMSFSAWQAAQLYRKLNDTSEPPQGALLQTLLQKRSLITSGGEVITSKPQSTKSNGMRRIFTVHIFIQFHTTIGMVIVILFISDHIHWDKQL